MLTEDNINMNAARHRTYTPNLDVIPSGPVPPNPSELLASRKMHRALREFSNRYDYIVLDSPPVLNMADATIMVLAYAETTREEAVKVHQQLQMAKANVIGTVINGMPPNQDPYGYYGYYHDEDEEPNPKKKPKKKKKSRQAKDDEDFDLDFDPERAYEDF